jgi:multidrug efflux system membrane fusion protein
MTPTLPAFGLALAAAVASFAPADAQQTPAGGGVPVHVTTATNRDVPVLQRNVGLVQAFQSVLVRARVDGTLDSVNYNEGQEVKRGDLLAQIDPRPYQAAVNQATAKKAADEANLVNARRDLQRDQELVRTAVTARQVADTQAALVAQLAANVQGDAAAVDTAQLNLDFTHITAPIDGRVGLRLADPGNLVHATDATGLVTIAQIRPIAVIFSLPQDTLPEVVTAMAGGSLPVQCNSSDDNVVLSKGTLLTIDNNIDQTTGTYKLKAVFPNQDNHLWPGQFVNVRLQTKTLTGAVTVPSPVIQRGPNGLYVYVVKPDNTAAVQSVKLVQDDGKLAVIASGLDAGAKVVLSGQSKLENGSRVAATDEPAGS